MMVAVTVFAIRRACANERCEEGRERVGVGMRSGAGAGAVG